MRTVHRTPAYLLSARCREIVLAVSIHGNQTAQLCFTVDRKFAVKPQVPAGSLQLSRDAVGRKVLRKDGTMTGNEITIPLDGVILSGELIYPSGSSGLVLFAHGSG